ncbi:MAG: glycosyltransferase family 2 protein [Rickettsiaceae bacterium]
MKTNLILKISLSAILIFFPLVMVFLLENPMKSKLNKLSAKSDLKKVEQKNLSHDAKNNNNLMTKTVKFDKNGIDNIALISMVKDEDDIIYENLVWHFCVGFRKFVIINNNSTDKTRFLIEKFRNQIAEKGRVIIVDDPILEYIQSQKTTGAMYLAHSIWPEVEWIFPVDADEFWYPTIRLQDIISNIPSNKDIIFTSQYNHFPIKLNPYFDFSIPFYSSLNFRFKSLSPGFGKIALRGKLDMIIAQGNHSANPINYNRKANYVAGNKLGLDMRHFQMRSLKQTEKKYLNGANANNLGQKLGLLSKDYGTHWSSFSAEVREKGIKKAAIDRFNSHVRPQEDCIQDPLPMKQAFELFKKLIAQ